MNSTTLSTKISAQQVAIIAEVNYYLAFLFGMILNTLIIALIQIANDQNMRVYSVILAIRAAINIMQCFISGVIKVVRSQPLEDAVA